MPARPQDLTRLEGGLEGATLWGLELDTRYRVLAATFEPAAGHHPLGDVDDRRLQLLMFPCSVIKAALTRQDESGTRTLERFEVEQLVDVVAKFDGAALATPVFDQPEPAWGPEVSLQGESSAPDGRSHTITVRVAGDGRALVVHAAFDEAQVLTPEGRDVPPAQFRATGTG